MPIWRTVCNSISMKNVIKRIKSAKLLNQLTAGTRKNYGMEAERCQAIKVIFKSINVFDIGLYFSNPFIFFKSLSIIFKSNYLFQIELYLSNRFIFSNLFICFKST